MGYGIMVAQQILVLLVKVRILVAQRYGELHTVYPSAAGLHRSRQTRDEISIIILLSAVWVTNPQKCQVTFPLADGESRRR